MGNESILNYVLNLVHQLEKYVKLFKQGTLSFR